MRQNIVFVFLWFLIILSSCQKKDNYRSFYYWKTTFNISPAEEKKLVQLHISKLYIRLFDVDWDEVSATTLPVGKIRFQSAIPSFIGCVPVVYLTTKALQKTPDTSINVLADRIFYQAKKITDVNHIRYQELQIDCDWTESTRDKYFSLLRMLQIRENANNVSLSATIRLHQIKYPVATGIPPVKRGMLMFYNMGSLTASALRNSIYNARDAAKYTSYIHKYPLPLDIALPIFSWCIHSRNDHIIDLMRKLPASDFTNHPNFRIADSMTFVATTSFYYRGYYFLKDDKVILEEVNVLQCKAAARQASVELPNTNKSVALFHFDSLTLAHYENKDLEEIFNTFH